MTGEFSSYIAAAFRRWALVLHWHGVDPVFSYCNKVIERLMKAMTCVSICNHRDKALCFSLLSFSWSQTLACIFLYKVGLVLRSLDQDFLTVGTSCSVVNTYCVCPFCFVSAFAFILIFLCGLQIKLQTHLANNIDNNNDTKQSNYKCSKSTEEKSNANVRKC